MRLKLIAASLAVMASPLMSIPAQAHQGEKQAGVQTAEGQGVVKGIDLKKGTVTLQHGPIAALKWPAMTMTFKVKEVAVLTNVTVGEKVSFELANDKGKPVVTDIDPLS